MKSSDSDKKGKGLSRRQLRAIPIILQGKNITDGAQMAGITRQTFYEWYRNSEFRSEFLRQRQESVSIALDGLKASASRAVEVLLELLNADKEEIKFRTASNILEHIGRFIEIESIEERITAIERKLDHG